MFKLRNSLAVQKLPVSAELGTCAGPELGVEAFRTCDRIAISSASKRVPSSSPKMPPSIPAADKGSDGSFLRSGSNVLDEAFRATQGPMGLPGVQSM